MILCTGSVMRNDRACQAWWPSAHMQRSQAALTVVVVVVVVAASIACTPYMSNFQVPCVLVSYKGRQRPAAVVATVASSSLARTERAPWFEVQT